MIENIKSFCKFLRYDESDGHWVARISENYFKHLEFYIAGDAKGINPILEKEAVRVIKNFSVVESIVKAYLAEIKSTTFESTTNLVVHFNHYPNTESLWEIMWLEFLDINQLDQYEVFCCVNDDPGSYYDYCRWIVTLQNDTPIGQRGEFW